MLHLGLSNQILHLLVLAAGVQGLVLSFIIALDKPKIKTFYYLGLFFLLISLGCIERVTEGMFYPPRGEELPFPMSFKLAYIPAIYLHVKYLINPNENFKGSDLFHFLPSFFLDFLSFFLIVFEGNRSGLGVVSDPQLINYSIQFYDFLFFFQFPIYLLAMARLDRIALSAESISNEGIIKWHGQLTWLIVLFWLGWTTYKIAGFNSFQNFSATYFLQGIIIFSIYWVGYSFLLSKKKRLINYINKKTFVEEVVNTNMILEEIILSEIYKKEKVSLSQVSEQLGYSEKIISKAINSHRNSNFNEFINGLRIDNYKKLVVDPSFQKYSLLGLAREVGFSSKTSFHRAFKKSCGQTPKEYLETHEAVPEKGVSNH